MLTLGCLQLCPGFTDPDAFVPRVHPFRVTSASAIFKPGTVASATTASPRFLDGAAFGTYQTNARRCCGCRYEDGKLANKNKKGRKTLNMELVMHTYYNNELTVARFRAF